MSASVLISTSTFGVVDPSQLARLRSAGLEIALNPHGRQLTEDEVTLMLAGHIGLIAGTEPLTRAVMEANPQLKVISRVGAGTDNVDRIAADELGVLVCNTPQGPALAVAELALALTLDVLRGVSRADARIREGIWKKENGRLLSGKTVGIVGYGNVGRTFATLLAPFGCRIVVFDPLVSCASDDSREAPAVEQVPSLDELLVQADVVSLHCVRCAETIDLLDAERISLMKAGAVLVNTSRGGIVDEVVLADALDSGRLAGAGLDVFAEEPYAGPLRDRDNVVLTPHVGSYAVEARASMEADAVANLLTSLGLA